MNRFDDVKHEYYIGDRLLLSVTKFIGQFERPFNAPMIANMVAKKSDRTPEDVLNEWDLKRGIAVDYGNSIHKAIELYLKYDIKPTQPHLLKCVEKFIEQFGHMNWSSEERVFSEKYELGGTIDLLEKGRRIIADIKTNDTLKESSKGNFLKPLNKLQVSNLNKVRLQTKIYQELLGGEWERIVYMWNGEDFEIIELEDIDVQPLLHLRLAEIM